MSSKQTAAEARAEAQANAAANKAARATAIDEHFADGVPGSSLLVSARVLTALFTVVTVAAAAIDTRGLRVTAAFVDLALFVLGCVLFLVALLRGAQRSRDAEMTMAGWWFLSGAAPTAVRVTLLGAVGVQTVVGIAGAAIRPLTALAFGVLVPTLGLAMCGLWSARHGMFPPRRGAQR